MALVYLGSATVGSWIPSLNAVIGFTLPELQAQLTGLIQLAAQLTITPPTIAASLTLAVDLVAAINAQIALGITFPGLSAQLSIIASLVASISLNVNLLLAFQVALGTAGVHGYAYAGAAAGLGPALTTELAGGFPAGLPGDSSNALILATTVPAAWAALATLLTVS